MKRILFFILPILVIVALSFAVFGMLQVDFEKEKLMDDVKQKTKSIAESMELAVKQVLVKKDKKSAEYLVKKFEGRDELEGSVIYNDEGKVIAVTSRFADWETKKPYIKKALASKSPYGIEQKFKQHSIYSYVLPILSEDGTVLGSVEVLHDTSYVFARLGRLWQRISATLITLILLILFLSLLIQRHLFVIPIQRLTSWFHRFQRGEIDVSQPISEKGELGKLASEVEQVALSLRVARRSISDEAEERLQKEEIWTEAKLRDLTHARLGENPFFVVSNREPFMHVLDDRTNIPRCVQPPSGVATALRPILAACGGTWVAHGSGAVDRKFVNSQDKLGVPPDDIRYILKRVWLTKKEEEGYYFGFSNEGMWPLCHNTHTRPVFREDDWKMYEAVNRKFTQKLLEELPAENPFIFIQDYHFTLMPKMLKEARPDATIALFWHIPWPTAEAFEICPYKKSILEGMLGCDLIGFHVQNHCNNFLDTTNKILESRVDTEKFSIVRAGKETLVRAIPISINHVQSQKTDMMRESIEKLKKEFNLEGKIIGVGVDRIDYTKGLSERILAIDRFLEKYPQYKGKFVFIQIASPSRTHIKRYHDLVAEIDELIEKKNWKHGDSDWKPIIYLKKHFSAEEIQPFYSLADLCIVSSLHDGMNLVAKEYIAAKETSSGVLILSQFTGAIRELTDAIPINPYAIEEFAESIRIAIEMPDEEREKRMENMRKVVSENNVYKWAATIITELTGVKKHNTTES